MVQLRKESRRTLAPDQLGSYIKVSRPSVWMLLAVIAALLIAGIAWFFAGTVNESVPGICVAHKDTYNIYVPLSRSSAVQPGNSIILTSDKTDYQGTVLSIDDTPLSLTAIQQECKGADLSVFSQDNWGVAIQIETDAAPDTYKARIITASYRPIRLLLGLED